MKRRQTTYARPLTNANSDKPKGGLFSKLGIQKRKTIAAPRPVFRNSDSQKSEVDKLLEHSDDFFDKYAESIKRVQISQERLKNSPVKKAKSSNFDWDSSDSSESEKNEKVPDLKTKRANIIKEGIDAGYPRELVSDDLHKACQEAGDTMLKIFAGQRLSHFYNEAKNHAERTSKASISLNQLVEESKMPGLGYYGFRGQEIVASSLTVLLKKKLQNIWQKTEWMHKYSIDSLVVLILVPEMMIDVIAREQGISTAKARDVLDKATDYGRLQFQNHNHVIHRRTLIAADGSRGQSTESLISD